MTEHELLRVIQSAEQKFYDEAEQEIRQNPPAIRQTAMRRIIAIASAAAVIAVSVAAGIYAAHNRALTEPRGAVSEPAVTELTGTGTSAAATDSAVTGTTTAVTGTTTAAETTYVSTNYDEYEIDNEPAFTVVEADFHHYQGKLSMEELSKLESCAIYSLDELKQNIIQPVKEYSEEFFKDRALIFATKVFARTGNPKVAEVLFYSGWCDVGIEKKVEEGEEQKDYWWCTFLEVDRSKLGNPCSVHLHADDPREVKPLLVSNERKVKPEDARIPDLRILTGNWDDDAYSFEADGRFSVFEWDDDQNWITKDTGRVTIENGKYVLRYDSGKIESAVPDPDEPLNTLNLNGTLLRRSYWEEIPYDRQFTSVKESDFTGIPVTHLEGIWQDADPFTIWVYDCSTLTGSFRIEYHEWTDSYGTAGGYYTVFGTVRVEQGISNSGETAYFYNFYTDQNELLKSFFMPESQDDNELSWPDDGGEDLCFLQHRWFKSEFTRVRTAPQGEQSDIRVKAIAGEWDGGEWDSENMYQLRIYDCGDLSGRYEFRYIKSIDEAKKQGENVERYPLYKEGTVYLEQWINYEGETEYYYNFYDKEDKLFMSINADRDQDEEGVLRAADYGGFKPAPWIDLRWTQRADTQ